MTIDSHQNLMSIDESLSFIKEQIKAFKGVLGGYLDQRVKKSTEIRKVDSDIELLNKSIYKLRSGLSKPSIALREEFLRNKIRLESDLELYQESIKELSDLKLYFDKLYKDYKSLVLKRKKNPENSLSSLDKEKLSALTESMRSLLREFGFSSFSPDNIEISQDSYLPTREGFDIGFDTSASDGIRLIWSYLIALFELENVYDTNHPGVLVFDEPRQQEANKVREAASK